MASDEYDVTVEDLSLNALWHLAEADLAPQQVGPVAEAAAKIAFFTGAAAVLSLLPSVYGIDARSPAAQAAAGITNLWEYEIQAALPRAFPFEPKV